MEIKKTDAKGRISLGHKDVNYFVESGENGSITLRPVPQYEGLRIFELAHGEGKTTELVRIILSPGNEDVLYVAPTNAQARVGYLMALRVLDTPFPPGEGHSAITHPKLFKRFMSYETYRSREIDNARIVIDEFDGVLNRVFDAQVLAVAGTDSDKKRKKTILPEDFGEK